MKTEFNDTRLSERRPSRGRTPIFGALEEGIAYTFSGKSAIALLLRYFRRSGGLRSRADQILVPHWLGAWVYMTMHEYCFPSTVQNPLTRGIFVYHQWGFPQEMDPILAFCKEEGLFCIEDCAHAFESEYRGRRVGTFGDAALFSLAKFFPCVAGGAIYTDDPELRAFIDDALVQADCGLSSSAFRQRADFDADPSPANRVELARNYAAYDKIYKVRPYALALTRSSLARDPLPKRQSNYRDLAQAFSGYDFAETLPVDGVMPWVFPLFVPELQRGRVVKALLSQGIESGEYHFDLNRNLLNPDFRRCVAIPCHQGLTESELSSIVELVKDAL